VTTPAFALALALSLGGLVLGPLLFVLGRRRVLASAALEGLTIGLIPLLVLLRITPHLYAEIGLASVGLLALGFVGVLLVERRSHAAGAYVGRTVVVPALTIHAALDGAALALAFSEDAVPSTTTLLLGSAIVLHRLPEGLFVARTVGPTTSLRGLALVLAVLCGATVAGALFGRELSAHVPDGALHGLVAVGLGAMVRLVTHRHGPGFPSRGARMSAMGGLVAGVALVVLIPAHEGAFFQIRAAEWAAAAALGAVLALGVLGIGPRAWLEAMGAHEHTAGPEEHADD